jgi:signal transduction histidine kinase
MNPQPQHDIELLNTFVKSAQYIVGLSSHQDLLDHLGKLVVTYFKAEWTAFVQQDSEGELSVSHCLLPGDAVPREILTDEVRVLVKDVLNSGFLASQAIGLPTPSMVVFLPIVGEHQPMRVLLIGHKTADPLPNETLNIYLALAGLAGTMLERLRVESELNVHRTHLEELVKARTAELTRVAEELQRSNKELEAFAYVSSHDLQEPLRMVTGFMQLIDQKYHQQLDATGQKYVHHAVEGAKRMQQLIVDLLAYSRVGTQGKQTALADTAELLQRALFNLQQSVVENNAKVTWGNLPMVPVDGSQLIQVFQNLIGNAIKFHGDQPPRIHVDARRDGKHWVFSVRDNGIGIDPEFGDKIFVIFQRLHVKEKYSGTGIGLAICKKIIERHGGRIWVESREGQGATFHFTLPAQQ